MIVALLLAAVLLFARLPRLPERKQPNGSSTESDLARLLSIGAAAGLPLGAALDLVQAELRGTLGEEVARVLASARTTGLTAALLASSGLGSLGPALARAHSTGSPIRSTLQAHLAAATSRELQTSLERARTAPVKLMVPLALLLLPGFSALVVGPTLLDHLVGITRLGP